ncbi:MAG: hypothetical protein MR508_05670 [Lachnospiraceae bacterium]|nr:hypothetical protein [Lachnospiraceae bacterium]
MYADYGYYTDGYLLGRSPAVPEAVYPYWEKQAERVLNQYTFSRLASNFGLITDEVKDCTCELAELLYQADRVSQQASEQGGILTSFSNDGESGTFDLSQSNFTEEGKARKAKEIICRYLGNTGLLYQGV